MNQDTSRTGDMPLGRGDSGGCEKAAILELIQGGPALVDDCPTGLQAGAIAVGRGGRFAVSQAQRSLAQKSNHRGTEGTEACSVAWATRP